MIAMPNGREMMTVNSTAEILAEIDRVVDLMRTAPWSAPRPYHFDLLKRARAEIERLAKIEACH